MARPPWEVADIFRRYGGAYRQAHATSMSLDQIRVMNAIEVCRTAALGGHVEVCARCDERQISYNSCRNRHCPKCQSVAKARWLEARLDELLPVEYFHVVFTVPQQIAGIGLQNKRRFYNLLFRTCAETLRTIAADPKHLGAEIGLLTVLHTWGQTLTFHPHLHCIVPGGGFSPERQRWIACRPGFFLPVRVLSRFFRRRFLQALRQAYRENELTFHGQLIELREPKRFEQTLEAARQLEWVVYAKPPFGGPEKVLGYLGRYTHRVAISNHRIIGVHDGNVTFRWRDYRHESKSCTMTLGAEELIRRFLLHVLPNGFMRIRYFGFLANRNRSQNIDLARRLIQNSENQPVDSLTQGPREDAEHLAREGQRCPKCQQGYLRMVQRLPPVPTFAGNVKGIDSS